jgi:hypothetical protein
MEKISMRKLLRAVVGLALLCETSGCDHAPPRASVEECAELVEHLVDLTIAVKPSDDPARAALLKGCRPHRARRGWRGGLGGVKGMTLASTWTST